MEHFEGELLEDQADRKSQNSEHAWVVSEKLPPKLRPDSILARHTSSDAMPAKPLPSAPKTLARSIDCHDRVELRSDHVSAFGNANRILLSAAVVVECREDQEHKDSCCATPNA